MKAGLVGLGRLGKSYLKILKSNKKLSVEAACSQDLSEREWAKSEMAVPKVYDNYTDMIQNHKLDVVFILSSSNMHVEHIKLALESGAHVFSEKPLSIHTDICDDMVSFAKKYPKQKVAVGFARRFDENYREAKKMVEEGCIGDPYMVIAQSMDHVSVAPFQIDFVDKGGGIFLDYHVHDVDMVSWILRSDFDSITAVGGSYLYKEFQSKKDADCVSILCKMKNNTIANIYGSRIASHGHASSLEIRGTKGWLRVGDKANKNNILLFNENGIHQTCYWDFWDRFKEGFPKQVDYFIDCIIENKNPEIDLLNASKATKIAIACRDSFLQKKTIYL